MLQTNKQSKQVRNKTYKTSPKKQANIISTKYIFLIFYFVN